MGGKGRHRPKIDQPPVETALRALAGRQAGNVARRQLLPLGLSTDAIKARLGNGSFVARYRGVYALAPARQDPQALIHAAVLAGGPTAVASHGSAGWLWGFVRHYEPPAEISLPTGDRRPRHILAHRCPSLAPRDVTHQRGVPSTTPAGTALDLASRLTRRELKRLVNDQRDDGHLTLTALQDVIERNPLHPGTKLLTPFVENPTRPTKSPLEDEFLAFIAKYGLPTPEINFPFNGRKLDAYFPDHGLIVELDGPHYHSDQDAFEEDRERDADHLDHGHPTMRITTKRLAEQTDHEAARLERILSWLTARSRVGGA